MFVNFILCNDCIKFPYFTDYSRGSSVNDSLVGSQLHKSVVNYLNIV